MQIEIKGGKVLMHEAITRRIARAYSEALFNNVSVNGEGDTQNMSPMNVERASEALVLALIERVIVTDADGKETFIEASPSWLGDLLEEDFRKIESEALRIKNTADRAAKK